MQLYEIAEDYRELVNRYNEAETDEELDAIGAELVVKDEQFERRVLAVCQTGKNISSDVIGIDAEIKRLQALKSSQENRLDRLKNFTKTVFNLAGIVKLDLGIFKPRVQSNSQPSIRLDIDPAALPEPYRKMVVEYKQDTQAILEDWKAGKELPEYIHVEKGNHFRFG